MSKKIIYLIGSLKNDQIPHIANKIRELGFEVFDDWFSPGPEADDFWRNFEKVRGTTHKQALSNYAAKHIYEFDKFHIDRSNMGVLVMPAGKSGHLELGYMIGQGKPCFILFDEEPEKWDIMHAFTKENGGDICYSFEELQEGLEKLKPIESNTKISMHERNGGNIENFKIIEDMKTVLAWQDNITTIAIVLAKNWFPNFFTFTTSPNDFVVCKWHDYHDGVKSNIEGKQTIAVCKEYEDAEIIFKSKIK